MADQCVTTDPLLASLNSKEQAVKLYSQCLQEEDVLGKELDHLLDQQSQVDVQIASFQKMIPSLQTLYTSSEELCSVVSRASQLAESISSKVKILDLAKRNVYSAMQRVDDIIGLKSCVDGVEKALAAGNYEEAAVHIRRYLDLDESVLMGTVADDTKGAAISNAFALLKKAEIELRQLVTQKLSNAVQLRNSNALERFVRICPQLNMHSEGLDSLTQHLNTMVRESSTQKLNATAGVTGDRTGVAYADTLTVLYESVARALDSHQQIVFSCYGASWVPEFIKRLQGECDRQVKCVIKQMEEERLLDHRVQTISVALHSRHTAGAIRPDPRELDTLLTELSLCSSRTELYFRFMTKKVAAINREEEVAALLRRCSTNDMMQELIGKYIMIENYYMKETLDKAISVAEPTEGGVVTSLPDDSFYILLKSLRRAFSTANIDGACAMINNASSLLLSEYKTELRNKLHPVSTTSGTSTTYTTGIDLSDIHGMFHATGGKASNETEQQCRELATAINNIDISVQNLKKLITGIQDEITRLSSQIGDGAKLKLDSCLAELCSVSGQFQELHQEALSWFVEKVMLPQVKPSLDQFSSTSHCVEDELGVAADGSFVQGVMMAISKCLDNAESSLLRAVYEECVLILVAEINITLEQQIMHSTFNQLGGVRLDRDIRQLVAYLSTRTQHPLRDKFVRVMQMASILSVERVNESVEYWNMSTGPALWHLSSREVKQILHLRKDFKTDEIDSIRFTVSTP